MGLDTIQIGEEVGRGEVRKRSNAAGYKKLALGFEPIRNKEKIWTEWQ